MLRSDNSQPFWKENFLAGFPKLLEDKVRRKLEDKLGPSPIKINP